MNQPLCKFMKVGLVHFMAFPTTIKGDGPIAETVRQIAADEYFSAIEVTAINDPAERMKVRKMIETAGMTLTYGGQPRLLTRGLNINDANEEKRNEALANLKAGIDEAYELGATGFAFLSGKYEQGKEEEALDRLIASTNELCRYSKSKGDMRIALEVFDYDVDKKSLIGPAGLAARYAGAIRHEHDHFGLMVDLSHIPLIHETLEESLLPVKDYIIHAHIGNCVLKSCDMPAYGDHHPRFGFPDGENNVEEVTNYLRMLMDIGFLNEKQPPIVSFEIKPFEDEDPGLVIANAKRTLNEAWARL